MMEGNRMETLKKSAIDAISKLPDTASIDDIMYRLYVIDKIRKGQEAIKSDEAITLSELKKEVAKW
jgi:hypothetical protein